MTLGWTALQALADFARHLSLSARHRTAGAYLDTLQRLIAFGLDPLSLTLIVKVLRAYGL